MASHLSNIKTMFEPTNRKYYDIERFFDGLFNNFSISPSSVLQDTILSPRIDVTETKNEYCIDIDLPGLVQSDIEVRIDDNILTINGKREENFKQEEKDYHVRERYYGTMQRSIMLPSNINSDNINANLESGILHIKIPKQEKEKEKETSKRIEIKS
jgi:HSP20 family protein